MRETWVECVIVSCSSHTVSRSRGTRHTRFVSLPVAGQFSPDFAMERRLISALTLSLAHAREAGSIHIHRGHRRGEN